MALAIEGVLYVRKRANSPLDKRSARSVGATSECGSAIETGWGQNFALRLLDYQYSDDSAPNSANIVSGFDAAILRIPHGWMKAEEITR